jgi:hypothetical protein
MLHKKRFGAERNLPNIVKEGNKRRRRNDLQKFVPFEQKAEQTHYVRSQ